MNKQEIKGNIFIIPNMLTVINEEKTSSDFVKERWNNVIKPNIEKIVGHKLSDDELLVEVWAYTPDDNNSNWSCHSWPGEKICRFPNYLPYKDLEGLKEGETKVFESENFVISLTANQLGTRYRRFGSFEEVLKDRKEVWDVWESGGTIYIGGIPCKK